MIMNKTQKGFAALEAVLILIILITVGGVGWYVVHTKHQTDKILAQSDKISQSAPSGSLKSSPGIQTQRHLTLKEWGVSAPYNGVLNLKYSIANNTASFSSVEFDNATNGKCSDYGGAIEKLGPNDIYQTGTTASEVIKDQNPPPYSIVNGYYYIYVHSQALCPAISDPNSAAGTLQSSTNDAVKSTTTKLSAVP